MALEATCKERENNITVDTHFIQIFFRDKYPLLRTGLEFDRDGTDFIFFPTKQAQLFPSTSWAHPGRVWSQ